MIYIEITYIQLRLKSVFGITISSHEKVDQLAKDTLDQKIDPLPGVHYTDLKPLVNSYIQQLVQTKWDVAVHGIDLYLVKPTLW